MKIKISLQIIILLTVCSYKANSAITLQNIKNLLGKYCYPAENSICKEEEVADYDLKTGYCKCKKEERYWDNNSRVCKECELSQVRNKTYDGCADIVCPFVTKGQIVNKTCPKGSILTQIQNGKCPKGMILWKFEDK